MPTFCSQCGTALEPEAQFCEECGTSVSGKVSPTIVRSKRTLLLTVLSFAAVLGIGALFLFARREGENLRMKTEVSGEPSISKEVKFPVKAKEENVLVNDFRKYAKRFSGERATGYIIANTNDGSPCALMYYESGRNQLGQWMVMNEFSAILITDKTDMLDDVQKSCEGFLLRKLGVTEDQACNLNIELLGPAGSGPSNSNKRLSLTFCSEEARKARQERRIVEFGIKNNVQAWPDEKQLSVNPFMYEGKNVGIIVSFTTMTSATEGLFSNGGEYFLVSDIPGDVADRWFTQEWGFLLAGKVVGKKQVNVNVLFGTQLNFVTQLSFVAALRCKQKECGTGWED
jgi:hypothetical protein